MVSFVMELADIKHKSSEAYLVKFKENLFCGLKLWTFSSKVMVLKHVYILKDFTSIKK